MSKKSPFPTDLRNALNKALKVTFERVTNKDDDYMYACLIHNGPLDVFVMWEVSYIFDNHPMYHGFYVCVGHPRDRRTIKYFTVQYSLLPLKVQVELVRQGMMDADKIIRDAAINLSKGFVE